MAFDSNRRPSRGGSDQELWPKWMWVAAPVLVIVVVGGLWWAIFYPSNEAASTVTPTPTLHTIHGQPTQAPTTQGTTGALLPTPTQNLLPTPIPTLAAPQPTAAPTAEPTAAASAGLAIGDSAKVTGVGGGGLNMRSGAGTGHARVKTLRDGAILKVIGGSKEANGYTWWEVRDEAGTTGWVASEWLAKQ